MNPLESHQMSSHAIALPMRGNLGLRRMIYPQNIVNGRYNARIALESLSEAVASLSRPLFMLPRLRCTRRARLITYEVRD